MEKPKILAVVGPTASGKTSLALRLARRLNGEIVSCDSMQIYRHMTICTAAPTAEETGGIPYHMVAVAEPDEDFSCADYASRAVGIIDGIISRDRLPIICGGTGLYLDALLRNGTLPPQPTPGLRRELADTPPDELYRELCTVDPDAAVAIHPNNLKRVRRAVEIYRVSGITKTEWDRRSLEAPSAYDAAVAGLYFCDREILYRRIDRRVDEMLSAGLIDEIRSLPVVPSLTASAAIGFREITAYLRGRSTLEEAAELMRRNTRRYAKRQLTWFTRRGYVTPLWVDKIDADRLTDAVIDIL